MIIFLQGFTYAFTYAKYKGVIVMRQYKVSMVPNCKGLSISE